ncbi:CRISPR-associated endonuclease Cas2 [Candidatus Giovannonibacteria bacterium]|nr:CRISPR-associated endonuclease Cas2 [Candidatus Giovannonibacteria bacterium]
MRYGKLTGKILSLLANGLLLGYTHSKNNQKEILEECDKIWLSIDKKELFQALRILKLNGFLDVVEDNKGNKKAILTPRGKERGMYFNLDSLSIKKPKKWDKKWRVVVFDIPEERRKIRNALRTRLKNLGFHEMQRSVFVFPYACDDEINILVNVYGLKECVRLAEATFFYDQDIRKRFKI